MEHFFQEKEQKLNKKAKKSKVINKGMIDFVSALGSNAPFPGGGGAVAYVGALAMALGAMVGNFTLGKEKYADVEEDMVELLEKSEKYMEKLILLSEKDAKVFEPLSIAYGLPTTTEEEKKEKEIIMEEALWNAAQVPLKVMKHGCKVLEILEQYALKGNRLVISDAGVGAALCRAAIEGAKLNVLINVKFMKNKTVVNQLMEKVMSLEGKGITLANTIYNYVEKEISPK